MDGDEVTNLAAIYWKRVSTQQCVGIMLDHHGPQAKLTHVFVSCCKRSQDLASERGRS